MMTAGSILGKTGRLRLPFTVSLGILQFRMFLRASLGQRHTAVDLNCPKQRSLGCKAIDKLPRSEFSQACLPKYSQGDDRG